MFIGVCTPFEVLGQCKSTETSQQELEIWTMQEYRNMLQTPNKPPKKIHTLTFQIGNGDLDHDSP